MSSRVRTVFSRQLLHDIMLLLDVKPTISQSFSTFAVTRDRAPTASRQEIGKPDTGVSIEPDTSQANRIRLPEGSTAPYAL